MRIAVLSPAPWASFRGSMHHTAIALASMSNDVLYVDPPVSPLSIVRQRERMSDLVAPRLEHPMAGLTVWRPRVPPGQASRLGQRIVARTVAAGVHRHLGAPELSVCFHPDARGAIALLPGRRVYSCIDSLEDHPDVDPIVVRRNEEDLLRSVDVSVACSARLVEQLADRGSHAEYVPHGCDDATIAAGVARPACPDDLRGAPRPLLGYVGSMNFRIDGSLLAAAASAAPDGTVVLVGGAWSGTGPAPERSVALLTNAGRVRSLGHRSAEVLPAYLANLDVGLVPYRRTPFNRKSYPLKIPQYLAVGCPVVSTPNGATDALSNDVCLARDESEFATGVQSALLTPIRVREERRARAASRTWKVVADELLAHSMGR